MRWDDRLGQLFEDLEHQAEGLALSHRDAEVAELARAEYAQVDLAARLHGSLGLRVLLSVDGVGAVEGSLSRVGLDWCLLHPGSQAWLVRLAATGSLRGLAERAAPVGARPATAQLGFGSALRSVAEAQVAAVLHKVDGSLSRGVLARVGADFLDLRGTQETGGYLETVPFRAIAAVRSP
jgi:hypothetical protein